MGGIIGGWSLYAKDGKPKYCYNFFGLEQTFVEAPRLPAGTHQVRMEFAYDGGGLAKGGTSRSTSTARRSAPAARAHRAVPFSGDET